MANDNLDFYLTKAGRKKRDFGKLEGYDNSADFMNKLSSPEPYQTPPANPNMEAPIPTEPTNNLLGNNMLMSTPQAPPAATTTPQKPVDAFSDYWKTPVVGKIPLDRFVQMAGMISASLDPDSPMGRMGANLQQMGGLAAAERARREEKESDRQLGLPKEALQTRLLEAQIKKAEIPEEPKRFTDVQKNQDGVWEFGGRDEATGEFKSYRKATDTEIESKVTGTLKPTTIEPIQIGDQIVYVERDPKTGKRTRIEGVGGPKWRPKDTTGKEDIGRTKAFTEYQDNELAILNAKEASKPQTDDMGQIIPVSPERVESLNKIIKGYENRNKELSDKYEGFADETTKPTTITLTPEQQESSKLRYKTLINEGKSHIEAIKIINKELNEATSKPKDKTIIPKEPPKSVTGGATRSY